MRYLLDTHTILWFLEGSDRLSETAAQAIEDVDAQNHVSIASLWEFTIKHSLGKLRFEGGVSALWKIIEANGFIVTPITQAQLKVLSGLPFEHRDPFDRLLIAAALAGDMTILTADENIQKYHSQWKW